jgi:plastocyanin
VGRTPAERGAAEPKQIRDPPFSVIYLLGRSERNLGGSMRSVNQRMTRIAAGMVVAAGLTGAGLLLAGSPAGAADASGGVTVRAGVNAPKDPTIAVLEFLPEKIRVKTGSTVTWSWKGTIEPHSVTFLAPGQTLPPPGSDPALFGPTPATGPIDGSAFVNSGLQPLGPAPVTPLELTFSKPGKFSYYCVIHPGMVGQVNVVDSGKVDTPKSVVKRAAKEQKVWVAEGAAAKAKLVRRSNISTKNSDGTKTFAIQMGATTEHTDILAFAPTPKGIKAGDSIKFVNNSGAPHTGTFAGQQPPIVDPTSPESEEQIPGPSPQTLNKVDLFNTGLLPPNAGEGPDSPPPPKAVRSYTYVVPEKGKYEYYCILHTLSGMGGVVRAK